MDPTSPPILEELLPAATVTEPAEKLLTKEVLCRSPTKPPVSLNEFEDVTLTNE
jgi:hypothetical protein